MQLMHEIKLVLLPDKCKISMHIFLIKIMNVIINEYETQGNYTEVNDVRGIKSYLIWRIRASCL